MANNARDELVRTLKNLLESAKYSDLVITCGADMYNVNKAVVCARSGFFERAERFPVGKEHAEGKIDLPEDEPAIIKLLVQYLYEGEYEPKLPDGDCMGEVEAIRVTCVRKSGYHYNFPHTCELSCKLQSAVCHHHVCHRGTCSECCVNFICKHCCADKFVKYDALPPANGETTQLLLHAKMYEIGDKYDVQGLQQLAREKFLRACVEYWNDDNFAPAAHLAFTTTPESDDGLRTIISNIISQHMVLLNKPEVEALLNEFNGLAVDLLKKRGKEMGWMRAD